MNTIIPSKFPALQKQAVRLKKLELADPVLKQCSGMEILVYPKVYPTSIDTELMIDTVRIEPHEKFLEIGCGTGAISVSLAQRAKSGLAGDMNPEAIKNTSENARRFSVKNLSCVESNVFHNVTGLFDVIVCNPPYSKNTVTDVFQRMFWDPEDEMKIAFFSQVKNFLAPNGRIYFGWADFADIDVDLPCKLAQQYGFKIAQINSRSSTSGEFTFYVFELSPL